MTDTSQPWRIGVLFSQTGTTAVVERTMARATQLAIEEINAAGGVLGRPLEPVEADCASDPKVARRQASYLLGEEQVPVIFGCYMSSTRKAVTPLCEQFDALLFYPTLYEGFEYVPNCIYTGAAPNQNSLQLGQYLTRSCGERFYFVGSNYVFPYESNRIMADLLRAHGAKVLEERYVPLNCEADAFAPVLKEIEKLRPDVVFSTIVGSATATFYRAFRQVGFDPAATRIASLTTSEAEVAEMGKEAAEGHLAAAPYFDTLATRRNRAFVGAFQERFGSNSPITASAEAAYFQVNLFARALEACGSTDTEALLEALNGVQYDAPQGSVRIDPDNNHTFLWPRVGKANAQGKFEIVHDARKPVKPDPYMVSFGQDAWTGALPNKTA